MTPEEIERRIDNEAHRLWGEGESLRVTVAEAKQLARTIAGAVSAFEATPMPGRIAKIIERRYTFLRERNSSNSYDQAEIVALDWVMFHFGLKGSKFLPPNRPEDHP